MSETNNDAPLQIRGNGRLTPAPSSRVAIEALEEPESSDLELEEYLRILLRRKWTVLGCLAVVLGLAVCYIVVTPRIYEATATFLVSEPKGAMEKALETELPPMAAAISAPELETHAALLQGPITAEETASWLKANGGPDMSAEEVRRSISTSISPKDAVGPAQSSRREPFSCRENRQCDGRVLHEHEPEAGPELLR